MPLFLPGCLTGYEVLAINNDFLRNVITTALRKLPSDAKPVPDVGKSTSAQ